ncbi:ABC transporter permease [Rhizobium sp. BK538]|uniref:ABC transporter permease n=1 Tax=Rhizobium sp. BK538 TaxID=2586984 RepID=UPI0016101CBF|nr:ABC transporter permease [Rhizobium sp. BK538]MBB4167368.1 lipopolysaccharide transport system permease protein [Rhizobium sp. BK538]
MQAFRATPIEMVASAWRNRGLISALTRREVIGRYRGSVLGILWSLFNPIFMLAVYTFVFGVVFKARWGDADETKAEFALVLFAGMIVFNFFAECALKAPALILGNVNYVKKVVFPLEILSWVNVGSALFHTLISICVWIAFYCIEIGLPHPTLLLFPFALLPLVFLAAGLGWLLSSLGVFLRDIGQIVGILTTVTMFLSPIFFPASALPEAYRPLLGINPLAPAIAQMRDVLYWGNLLYLPSYLVYLFFCIAFACLAFSWFQKTRKGFADVL